MSRATDWKVHELMGNDMTGWEWYVDDENSRYSHRACIREMQVWGEKVVTTTKFIPHYSTTWEGAGLLIAYLIQSNIHHEYLYDIETGCFSVEVGFIGIADFANNSVPMAISRAFIAYMETMKERDNG